MPFTQSHPVSDNETLRLAALHRYAVLDTPPDRPLDAIVSLACETFGVGTSLISLVDRDRQWFKARCGWNGAETSRTVSFCAYTILAKRTMVVPDATADARFSLNPLVTDGPRIRFYAGAPLTTPTGFNIGTLCLIDAATRPGMPARDRRQLEMLAQFAMAEIHKKSQPDDQRCEPRYPVKLPATINAYRREPVDVSIVNVSQHGALVHCAGFALPRGEEVVLAVKRSATVATVAWAQDGMIGLTFHKPLEATYITTLWRQVTRH